MPRAALMLVVLAAVAWFAPGQATDDRTLLNHCKALVAHATQPQSSAAADTAEIQHCQQIIREWTLRDSRMSVDESGRPLH